VHLQLERLQRRLSRERRARLSAEEIAEHATRDALHDSLTGLPNRALMMDRMESALARAAQQSQPLALFYLDLDRFKLINDTLGHSAGDRLLCHVATRLLLSVRPTDTVARLGGDEFTILCEGIGTESAARIVADRIAQAIAEPLLLEDVEISVTASVGIALSSGVDTDPEQVLRDGDTAMYAAKNRDGGFVFFNERYRVRDRERLRTESDLRHALERGEIFLDYQPVFTVSTGSVAGVEALARWRHPTRGVLGPDAFIPFAEEAGLISSLGDWILREACRTAEAWRRSAPALELFVNLSPLQLERPGFGGEVTAALELTGLPASALCLELTESALLEERASGSLAELVERGIRLAIDDFGTGYSSLVHLRELPVHSLKIDRSFVRGVETGGSDVAIVGAVVALAQALGLTVVAEGVETAVQLERLRGLGCDLAQGYHLAPPLPAEVIGDRYFRKPPKHLRAVS
jgi:diguanylate cyclase (GGDEF)-like protein